MKNKKILLFDLDGTILNTFEGLYETFSYACNKAGLIMPNREDFNLCIGPPLEYSFKRLYNLPDERITEIVSDFRQKYNKEGIYNCALYDGIADVLRTLKDNGKKICLATSKPEPFANLLMEHHKINDVFSFIGGSDFEQIRNTKQKVIEHVFKHENITNLDDVVMIGDTKYDIIGAKNMNISSIGVLYGFGTKDEIADADKIVRTPKELLDVLI